MATAGNFAAFSERVKDIFVEKLREHFALQGNMDVITEQVLIEKYGLEESAADEVVTIYTSMPHRRQRLPFIAIMTAAGTERRLGLGKQVVDTYHDPESGLPMIREMVAADMQVTLEIGAKDTNTRSEIMDLVMGFLTMYTETSRFSFLGSNYQIILRGESAIGGETDTPRPDGEGFDRIYMNRITVPITFCDYVDREGFDVRTCYNPRLTLEDDTFWKLKNQVIPLREPRILTFKFRDDFEDGTLDKWVKSESPTGTIRVVAVQNNYESGKPGYGTTPYGTIYA